MIIKVPTPESTGNWRSSKCHDAAVNTRVHRRVLFTKRCLVSHPVPAPSPWTGTKWSDLLTWTVCARKHLNLRNSTVRFSQAESYSCSTRFWQTVTPEACSFIHSAHVVLSKSLPHPPSLQLISSTFLLSICTSLHRFSCLNFIRTLLMICFKHKPSVHG